MKKETMQPEHFWIDLFCGAGGVTSGIVMSGCGKVIACVNHDKNAIESHKANHPDVLHFVEDIRILELQPLVNLVRQLRRDHPGCIIHLWASLECTNHSNAKGGLSRDEDSRTLDKTLYMKWRQPIPGKEIWDDTIGMYVEDKGEFVEGDSYMQLLDPDYLWIENVREFKKSGPQMLKQGKTPEGYPFSYVAYNKKKKKFEPHRMPIKERKGEFYDEFVNRIKGLGYNHDDRIFNCADFGMRTIRKRLFVQFPKKGLPSVWPQPTHNKNGTNGKKKWLPVRDILDFKDTGESIFNRKKPLVEKTLERIYAGLEKFIANGKPKFIMRYYSDDPNVRVHDIEDPAGVITNRNCHYLVNAAFLLKYNSVNQKTGKYVPPSVDEPAPVVSTQGRLGVVNPVFIVNQNHSSKTADVNDPAPSVLTKDKYSTAQAAFISAYYGSGANAHSPDNPSPAIRTKDGVAFIQMYYGSGQKNRDVNDPSASVPAVDKQRLVQPVFIMKYFSGRPDNKCVSADQPGPTVKTKDGIAIVQPEFIMQNNSGDPKSKVSSPDDPSRTITGSGGQLRIVYPEFLQGNFSRGDNNRSTDEPAASVTAINKHDLVIIQPWILDTNFSNAGLSVDQPGPTVTASRKQHYIMNPIWDNKGSDVDEPMSTVTASRRHRHYLMNPQYISSGGDVNQPAFTLIARTDKRPPYIITTEEGYVAIEITPQDSYWTRKIKIFMAAYGIIDIYMRMLKINELLQIQDFPVKPKQYILKGTVTEQKKYIGNAVPRRMVRALVRANYRALSNVQYRKQKSA